jgi:hypothetical protein
MPDTGITATGVLSYDSNFVNPITTPKIGLGSPATPIDDLELKPIDGNTLFSPVDQTITLPINYGGKAGRR